MSAADPWGVAPEGFRLPAATRPGPVVLQVADFGRSLDYYRRVLGLRVLEHEAPIASLGSHGDSSALVVLHERPGAASVAPHGRLGLYHFALLLPTRGDLGRFLRHLSEVGERAGASDHLVSEALYLRDPDGLGIEVYADRPRATWRTDGRELRMASDPLDTSSLLREAGDAAWRGMPEGTTMGHVHLHVGDLARAAAFYHDALGFDRTVWSYPGALFLSAGGYHHHLGLNTWAAGAEPPGEGEARLLEWTLELPDAEGSAGAARSLDAAGFPVETQAGGDLVVSDPWGTRLRLRTDR